MDYAIPGIKVRRKRKKPWSPQTKIAFCWFMIWCNMLLAQIGVFVDDTDAVGRAMALIFASLFAYFAQRDRKTFDRLRRRDEDDG